MEKEMETLQAALNSMRQASNDIQHNSDIDMHNLRQAQRFLEKFILDVYESDEFKKAQEEN